MPRKKPGRHNLHVIVEDKNYRILQEYCNGGIERISASQILNLFMKHYIEDFLAHRMDMKESASLRALQTDLPKATALIAHRIEPSQFKHPDEIEAEAESAK